MIRKLTAVALISTLSLTHFACQEKDDESTTEQTGQLTLNLTAMPVNMALALASIPGEFRDLPINTTGSGDGLYSLKMYFRSIQLCNSLDDNGSGYSNPQGCVDIYTNDSDTYNGLTGPTAAERATFSDSSTGKFYDVLSETDLASLNTGVAVAVGEYNYGIIETHPWVKIKARSGGLCTKAAGAVEDSSTGGDGIVTYHTKVDSLSCGDGEPEEVLSYITNANTKFKFLAPFSVQEGDSVILDLAFNLAQEVRALEGNFGGNLRASDADNAFYVPMIRIGAAPRLSTQTTKVETYLMGTAAQKEQVRVQFYYNSDDTSKSILGINGAVLATPASLESKANKAIYSSSVVQDGTSISLRTWDGKTIMSFDRGAAGTMEYTCESSPPYMLEECEGQETATYVYDAPVVTDL